MKTAWKWLKRIAWSLLATLALLALGIFILIRYYEDEVLAIVVGQISSQLTTEAHVAQADLTFWETFPFAGVRFEDVTIHSPEPFDRTDTLLRAERVFLSFSLLDVLRENYSIRKTAVENARVYLLRRRDGMVNWEIWKSSGDTSSLDLDLRNISFRSIDFTYEDRKSAFFTDAHIRNAELSGRFRDERFSLTAELSGDLRSMADASGEFILSETIQLDTRLEVDSKARRLTFGESSLSLAELPLAFQGTFDYGDKGHLHFRLKGKKNLDLHHLISLLPNHAQKKLNEYSASGLVQLEAEIKGSPSHPDFPQVNAHLVIEDGRVIHSPSDVDLSRIRGDLRYTKQKRNDLLTIRTLKGAIGGGEIALWGTVVPSDKPRLDVMIEGKTELSDLTRFMAWDTLETSSGSLIMSGHLTGPVSRDPSGNHFDFQSLDAGGRIELTNGVFRLKGDNREFREVSGTFLLSGTDASLQGLVADVNGSRIHLDGTARNFVPYLFGNDDPLLVDASFYSPMLDLSEWMESNTSSTGSHFSLPSGPGHFELKTRIDRLVYKSFEATDIAGITTLDRNGLTVHPASLHTSGGAILAQLQITPALSGFFVRSTASIQEIDIRRMFTSFGNFGQDFITDRHLRGKATADVSFSAAMTADLALDPATIESLVDIRIANGELIGLESLQGIADYLRNNRWIAPFVNEDRFAEKLRHIRFSELENTIRIHGERIEIPQMDIRSSAMDISAQGVHGFNKSIDYTIGFYLRDILIQRENNEESAEDRMGRQIFLYMRGTSDNPQFGIDKDAAKETRKGKIAEEKQLVKSLLKQEFGFFSRDSTIGPYTEPAKLPAGKTVVSWEEFDTPASPETPPADKAETPEKAPPPAAQSPRRLPKWLQEKDEYEKDP